MKKRVFLPVIGLALAIAVSASNTEASVEPVPLARPVIQAGKAPTGFTRFVLSSPRVIPGDRLPGPSYGRQYEGDATTIPYPLRCVGDIVSVFPDGYQASVSGFVVGARTIATVGHALYDNAHGGQAQSVTFISPFGTVYATTIYVHDRFISRGRVDGAVYDFGLITTSQRIGRKTGIARCKPVPGPAEEMGLRDALMTGIKTTSSRKDTQLKKLTSKRNRLTYRHQPSGSGTQSYHSELKSRRPYKSEDDGGYEAKTDRSGKKFVVAMQTRQDDDGGTVSLNLRSEFVRSIKQANQANP